jgi:hypothetical protein
VKVLIFAPGTDNAGVGIALKRAFDRFSTDWQARFVRRQNSQFDYPADIEWRKGDRATERVVRTLFEQADVIHVMQRPNPVTQFEGYERKTIIVHHIGTYYRMNREGVSAACRAIGAVEVAGSLDLVPEGNLELLPIVADEYPVRVRGSSDRIRIVHAPTNRVFKSTLAITAAIQDLAQRYPIDFDLIENVPWVECLERKAAADIFVDELTNGYGANALECWGMGIPVVSGVHDPRVHELMVALFGGLPFMEATPRTIDRSLEALVVDADLRAAVALRGKAHLERFHSGPAVVKRATDIYERAMAYRLAA